MAPSRNAVLLPKLFPTQMVKLGQFMPRPLEPNIKPYFSSKLDSLEDKAYNKADPESPYESFVSLDKNGQISFGLTHLLGAKLSGKSARLLWVKAAAMNYESLHNPDEVFKTICDDDATKQWIVEVAQIQKHFYFVVGIQLLNQANLTMINLTNMGADGHFAIPAEVTGSVPVEFRAGASVNGVGLSEVLANGVFGIEARRVEIRVKKSKDGPTHEPELSYQVQWIYAPERHKGDASEEDTESLSVGLGEFFPSAVELEEMKASGNLPDWESK